MLCSTQVHQIGTLNRTNKRPHHSVVMVVGVGVANHNTPPPPPPARERRRARSTSPFSIYIRIRPFSAEEVQREERRVLWVDSSTAGGDDLCVESAGARLFRRYRFNAVLDEEISQSEVFERSLPILQEVLEGNSATVMAYGQTGTGKTHTLTGFHSLPGRSSAKQPSALIELDHTAPGGSLGLIPRCCKWLLQELAGSLVSLSVSYLEIYNEQVFDLLGDERSGGLAVKMGRANHVIVPGSIELSVKSYEDLAAVLWHGERRRAVARTDMNFRSSRSHTLFNISLAWEDGRSAILCFADLGGSERWDTFADSMTAAHIRELTSINSSLTALGSCISALHCGRPYVPFRDSKLTRLLQHSLGGEEARALFIVTLSPAEESLDETLSSLQFADRAMQVERMPQTKRAEASPKAVPPVVGWDAHEAASCKAQLASLRIKVSQLEDKSKRLQQRLEVERQEKEELLAAMFGIPIHGGDLEYLDEGGYLQLKNGISVEQAARGVKGDPEIQAALLLLLRKSVLEAETSLDGVRVEQETLWGWLEGYDEWLRTVFGETQGEDRLEREAAMMEQALLVSQVQAENDALRRRLMRWEAAAGESTE
jgi:hypothetical protein